MVVWPLPSTSAVTMAILARSGKRGSLGKCRPPLSQPTAVFIHGAQQPMTSRQTELRDRYKDLSRPLPPGYTH